MAVDPAVIGVIGAAVGGTFTLSGQLLTETLKGRRERKGQDSKDARELRLAVRLVMEELAEASSLIESAAVTRRYWVAPRALPTDTWNQYRTVLAGAVDAPLDWRFITAAYDAINDLNWLVGHRRYTAQEVDVAVAGARLFPDDETREKWRSIRQAIAVLERTIGVQGPASRTMREMDDAERDYWPFGDGNDFDLESAMSVADEDEERRRAGDF